MEKHFKDASSALSGGDHKAPKKEIKEIRTRKGKSGGFIHEHHHSAPEHHPMEEHTSPDQDAMADHMMTNMGSPNPGEASDPSMEPGAPSGPAMAPQATPAAPGAGGGAAVPPAAGGM